VKVKHLIDSSNRQAKKRFRWRLQEGSRE